MLTKFKVFLIKVSPPLYNILFTLKHWRDLFVCMEFIFDGNLNISLRDRTRIVKQLYVISFRIECPHTQEEILSYIRTILLLSPDSNGVVVEAGCYRGGSTAKFSLAADIAGKELVVFDSFQGLPDHTEQHSKDIFGKKKGFKKGDYRGDLVDVKTNVSKYGKIACCRFVEGWFKDTLLNFREPVSALYLDVDLASSTRTCLRYLFPLLEPGGVLFSQDGHLPLVVEVFDSRNFWLKEVGCEKPQTIGLGEKKLLKITKEA